MGTWKKTLKNFSVLWVGVTAPLEIIEEREKNRGDRKIGSARWQWKKVHAKVEYDLIIDTHDKSIAENIELIENYLKSKL